MNQIYSKLIILILCIQSITTFAQLPPVTFPSGTDVCDYTPWKLVFYDGFDGTSIDASKWYTFNTNNSGTTDDWDEGRKPYPNNYSVIKDGNTVVSGGTLKLKLKQESTSWHCATCSMSTLNENYSSGYISSKMIYNNRRIETKLKMPIFKGAWNTCWFYHLSSVDEIDFIESSSAKGMLNWPYLGKRPNNMYNLHAYLPPFPYINIYNLPSTMTIGNDYPKQSWWNWFTNNRFHYDDWHTYVCEWDTASIKTYLDGELVNTIWKYYNFTTIFAYNGSYTFRVPSGCIVNAGEPYYISEGFPYNNESLSKLIFSSAMTIPDKTLDNDGELGQMEVDYIKVYQRHPEEERHTEICNSPAISITGPSIMCGTTAYGTSPATSGGVWSSNNGAVTFGGGPSGGSNVLVHVNPTSPYSSTILTYTFTPNGCPPTTVSKTIYTGIPLTNVFVSRNFHLSKESFSLWVSPDIAGATFSWKVWYGLSSSSLNYYTASGNYITTPKMWHYGILPYYLKWELTITTPCGSKTLTGIKDNMSYLVPMLSKPETFMENDSSVFYLETRFSNQDSVEYERTVRDIVATKFVEDVNDTIAINNMIGKIRMEALEPYLYFVDVDSERDLQPMSKFIKNNNDIDINLSKIYPNPASKEIRVNLSNNFNLNQKIRYKIQNLLGQTLQFGILNNSINISNLETGSYVLELYQSGVNTEHKKFIKE